MKFSVIVPVYNNKEWLRKCFDSILNQTYKNYEVIIVDDISTDDGIEIIREYEKKFKECKVIINKTKRLNGGTRNVGIAEATGDYIIFIDCDDWFKIDTAFETINNNINNEDIIFIGYDFHTLEFTSTGIPNYTDLKEAIKDVTCAPWTKVVKTNIIKETLYPEGTLFEDRIQHYRTILKCKTFKCIKESLYVWNRTTNKSIINTSKDYDTYRFNYCGELYRLIKELDDIELKEYIKQELEGYLNLCNEMVGELNG